VQRRLDAIERKERCRILFAVESGSRAWGFPSPDSDYDVRFVYARRAPWYLSIYPGRDVVETPIEQEMDVNGWDLRKALHLILKSNAVISEWLETPIVYRRDASAVSRLRRFADRVLNPRALTYHYVHLAQRQVATKLARDQIALKRYFYALRPALALRFLRLQAGRPPMHLRDLVARTTLPAGTIRTIEKLVVAKSRTREMGEGPRIPALDRLISAEIAHAARSLADGPATTGHRFGCCRPPIPPPDRGLMWLSVAVSAISTTLAPPIPAPYESGALESQERGQMAGAQAVRGTEGKSAWQAWRRGRVKMLGLATLKTLAKIYSRQSRVPDLPFIPSHHFPFVAELEANWQVIRGELDTLLEDRDSIPFLDNISKDQTRISHSQKWRAFFLWGWDEELTGNTARCPKTAALMRKVPNLRSAWFSILSPNYKIKAHKGLTKGILRAHLGLIVPKRWQQCRMEVDGEAVHWREGKCFVFDDSRTHQVWNKTDQERVILLLDFDRPMRWPASVLHRLAMNLLKRTAYYRDARKNLKRYESAQLGETARDQAISDAMQQIAG
jgi:predicted nucleotidyltransferase/aspartyl/asparaginyl beta-hydroxylase (cupin superfamily)